MNAISYEIEKRLSLRLRLTERMAEVCRMFGVGRDRLRDVAVVRKCRIELGPGEIAFIVGPSGSGKSILLRELYKATDPDRRIDLNRIALPGRKSVIDSILAARPDAPVHTGLRMLTKAGLADVFCALNSPTRLSGGEKYRYRLTRALALTRPGKVIFADEFCSVLDRITASVVAHNVRRFATRNNVGFILASCHRDIIRDLAPDVIVEKRFHGETNVVYRDIRRK